MEYCCHAWAAARSCYLELSDKLQKRVCRTVGILLGLSLTLSQIKFFNRFSYELAELVPFTMLSEGNLLF